MRELILISAILLLTGCGASAAPTLTTEEATEPTRSSGMSATPTISAPELPASSPANGTGTAQVVAVSVTGTEGDYTFRVTVASPDTGCDQYADWWEVLSAAGDLVYRRVLLHSHVDEQPFTRSGGPVWVNGDEEVIVRVHMNNTGYSPAAMRGSVTRGFTATSEMAPGYASEAAELPPLPQGCAF